MLLGCHFFECEKLAQRWRTSFCMRRLAEEARPLSIKGAGKEQSIS